MKKNSIAAKTESNIEKYLEKEGRTFYGMYKGDTKGGFCRIYILDRAYFVDYIIDTDLERLFVDVYPQIVCEAPYRNMMCAFISDVTSTYKSGRVIVNGDNGEVRVRTETTMVSREVSIKDITDMEHLAMSISKGIEKRLEKLAHGVYFDQNSPDLMSEMEKKVSDFRRSIGILKQTVPSNPFSMFDSDNDEDIFDIFSNDLESCEEDKIEDAAEEEEDCAREDIKDEDDDGDGEKGSEDGIAAKSFDDLFPNEGEDD